MVKGWRNDPAWVAHYASRADARAARLELLALVTAKELREIQSFNATRGLPTRFTIEPETDQSRSFSGFAELAMREDQVVGPVIPWQRM